MPSLNESRVRDSEGRVLLLIQLQIDPELDSFNIVRVMPRPKPLPGQVHGLIKAGSICIEQTVLQRKRCRSRNRKLNGLLKLLSFAFHIGDRLSFNRHQQRENEGNREQSNHLPIRP
jgi:hypothetical protein